MVENAHALTLGKGQGDSQALLCLFRVKCEVLPLVVEKEGDCAGEDCLDWKEGSWNYR